MLEESVLRTVLSLIMDVNNKQKEDGQALIEFILFLPFLIALLSLLVTISSSINGAINQQKAARAYFFHILKGNSTVPLPRFVQSMKGIGATSVGMFTIGWMDERQDGETPLGACYQVNSMLAGGNTDDCKDRYDHEGQKSRNIKVFTAFGVCGNLYGITDQGNAFHDTLKGSSIDACGISNRSN